MERTIEGAVKGKAKLGSSVRELGFGSSVEEMEVSEGARGG